jgi:hypothetical protein
MRTYLSRNSCFYYLLLSVVCLSSLQCIQPKHPGAADAVSFAPVQRLPDVADGNPAWSRENSLVCHVTAEPPTLHPTNGNSSPWQELNQYLHAFLINVDFRHPGWRQASFPSLLFHRMGCIIPIVSAAMPNG